MGCAGAGLEVEAGWGFGFGACFGFGGGGGFAGGLGSEIGGDVGGGAAEFGFVFAVALEVGFFKRVEFHEKALGGAHGFVVAELGG